MKRKKEEDGVTVKEVIEQGEPRNKGRKKIEEEEKKEERNLVK